MMVSRIVTVLALILSISGGEPGEVENQVETSQEETSQEETSQEETSQEETSQEETSQEESQEGEPEEGCPMETDPLWDITWPYAPPDTTCIQSCPGGTEFNGNALRYCDDNGVWSRTDVLSCASRDFGNLLNESLEAFSSNDSEVLLNQSAIVTSQLANITTGRELPLFPSDLQITNSLIHRVINILEDNADVLQQSSVRIPDVDDVISVFNNVLDESNTAGWLSLQSVETTNGSELLLSNAERYGLILAKEVGAPRRLSRPNIVLSASQFNVSSQVTDEDLSFPTGEDLVNYTSRIIPIMAKVPADLITENLTTSSSVPVVHILFNNLEDFLPPSFLDSSRSPSETSAIYSLQIGERKDQSRVLLEEPISLEFTFFTFKNSFNYTCTFWNFSKPIGSGGFSTDGVTTANITKGKDITSVQCLSNHATSFAVVYVYR